MKGLRQEIILLSFLYGMIILYNTKNQNLIFNHFPITKRGIKVLKQGIYEQIINQKLKNELMTFDTTYEIGTEPIDVEEARKMLSSYISQVTRRALKFVRENESDDKIALLQQIKTCNSIIAILSQELDEQEFRSLQIAEEGQVLTHIYSKMNSIKSITKDSVIRPVTPMSESSLFTGSHYEPNMLGELKKEIQTSDSIDMLVSFIKWSGLRCIINELETFTNQGGQLRVITNLLVFMKFDHKKDEDER